MRKIIYAICVFLNIHVAAAQETTNPFDFSNFDYQAYQIKLQKFLETLTPQEKIIFIMSQSKNSSSSSKECELDWSVKSKIDNIEDTVEKIHNNLSGRGYSYDHYRIECK